MIPGGTLEELGGGGGGLIREAAEPQSARNDLPLAAQTIAAWSAVSVLF